MRQENGIGKIRISAPIPGSCPVCATKHDAREPHDLNSLYYQNLFFKTHKRFPTWTDALHHCSRETKSLWAEKLKKAGINVDFQQEEQDGR